MNFVCTTAGVMLDPGHLHDAIGGLSERPSTRQKASQSFRQPAMHAMAVRYAHHVALTAGEVKRKVLVSVLMACPSVPKGNTLTWDAPEEVTKLACAERSADSAQGAADDNPASSSFSFESEDFQPAQLEWFQQRTGGQIHLVQCSSQGRLMPWCRDFPVDVTHTDRACGLEGCDKVCQKCWARAPL